MLRQYQPLNIRILDTDEKHVYINTIAREVEQMQWYLKAIRNYIGFSGRATRQEYWMFFLFNFIIYFVLTLLQMLLDIALVLSLLYSLAMISPSLAITFRRLHDIGKSSWWVLIGIIPYVGAIVLLVLACLKSEGNNRYGYNLNK